jgi:hypothetical protein
LVGEYAYTWCTTTYDNSIISLRIIGEPTASVTLHLLWPWLQLVPHTGWMIRKGTFRRPGASSRGAVGQHAISQEPMLGTGVASGFYHCMSLHVGATVRSGAEASLSGTARQHPRQCPRGQFLTQHLGHLPPRMLSRSSRSKWHSSMHNLTHMPLSLLLGASVTHYATLRAPCKLRLHFSCHPHHHSHSSGIMTHTSGWPYPLAP